MSEAEPVQSTSGPNQTQIGSGRVARQFSQVRAWVVRPDGWMMPFSSVLDAGAFAEGRPWIVIEEAAL